MKVDETTSTDTTTIDYTRSKKCMTNSSLKVTKCSRPDKKRPITVSDGVVRFSARFYPEPSLPSNRRGSMRMSMREAAEHMFLTYKRVTNTDILGDRSRGKLGVILVAGLFAFER